MRMRGSLYKQKRVSRGRGFPVKRDDEYFKTISRKTNIYSFDFLIQIQLAQRDLVS